MYAFTHLPTVVSRCHAHFRYKHREILGSSEHPIHTCVCVHTSFQDWFGYKPQEMMGTSITSVLTEARVLEEVLAGERAEKGE